MRRAARIAIVQSDHDEDDPKSNLQQVCEHVRRLRDRDLVVFPELALHGHHVAAGPPGVLRRALRAPSADEVEELHRLIASLGAHVVFGALAERDGLLHNLAVYSDAERRASYAKTHVHWSEGFSPGSDFPVFDTPLGRMGMLICFDAAFPEVPRLLALKGAGVIVNISAIPEDFPLEVVHRRLVACSVENQVFTLFANRRGDGFRGGSAVVGPTGEMLAVAGSDDPVLETTIRLDEVDAWREREPLFVHRRPELYGEIAKQLGGFHRPAPTTPK